MTDLEQTLQARLLDAQDPAYRDFQRRLIPTLPPEAIIGVRLPQLRAMAKELSGTPEGAQFLKILPHRYYEENNLHAYLIERIRDYDQVIAELERFLPWVDNWATCDTMSPAVFKRNLTRLHPQCLIWMGDAHPYTVRFGMGMLMRYFLDGAFDPSDLELVASVRSEEYYVKMMAAWYFATALAKQYEAALPYLADRRLDAWTHNKAIQKALESRRIPPEQKEFLRGLKVK